MQRTELLTVTDKFSTSGANADTEILKTSSKFPRHLYSFKYVLFNIATYKMLDYSRIWTQERGSFFFFKTFKIATFAITEFDSRQV
jgi:hypothetical protein